MISCALVAMSLTRQVLREKTLKSLASAGAVASETTIWFSSSTSATDSGRFSCASRWPRAATGARKEVPMRWPTSPSVTPSIDPPMPTSASPFSSMRVSRNGLPTVSRSRTVGKVSWNRPRTPTSD